MEQVEMSKEKYFMCEIATKELDNCIKYNDTERVRYFMSPFKLTSQDFDITKCEQWTGLAPKIKKLTQSSKRRNHNYGSVVGITLKTNKDVEIQYLI